MFRTVPLSIIRNFSLYTQQWYVSANQYDIYHRCVYSEKLLIMDRGTVRNMKNFIPKINLSNQCIQLVLLYQFVTMHGHLKVKYGVNHSVEKMLKSDLHRKQLKAYHSMCVYRLLCKSNGTEWLIQITKIQHDQI